MKIRLLHTLAGVAISFALSTFAQQKGAVVPRIVQQRDLLGDANALGEFSELSQKLDESYNKNDAGAVAALFTEDAVLVVPDGMFFGRQAIEKRYAATFQRSSITTFSSQICYQLNAIDSAVWSTGEWWSGLAQQRYVKSHRNLLRSPYSGPHPGTPYRPIRVTGVHHPVLGRRPALHRDH